jgi:hypothetical protein
MELLTNLNGGAKMVFKVKFDSDFSVNIQLVSINKDYVKNPKENNYMYYKDKDANFVLWSTQDFIFDERQIRLPDESNITDVMSHTHVFPNDKARYATLKKMYNTLQNWSKSEDMIKGVYVKTNKIVLAGDYWFIS